MCCFSALTPDDDIIIYNRNITQIGDYHAAHETWDWDGIEGESYIFMTKEVETLTDETLVLLIKSRLNDLNIKPFTISRGEVFTFFNFNSS